MADSNAPVKVERELGSDGQPTGKYVFVVEDLHHYYYEEFDPDRMERHLDGAGYTYREFRPMIAEMERQHTELTATAPAKGRAKPQPAEVETE